ncbi:MAG: ABC transporter ATP-binding protein [Methanobacteriota archaeon]|nr:MAG: ABC transporter ATP-binding protein [Euryarchaeota archaeon]
MEDLPRTPRDEEFDGVLVSKEIGAFDRVERVQLERIVISKDGRGAAFRGDRVAPHRSTIFQGANRSSPTGRQLSHASAQKAQVGRSSSTRLVEVVRVEGLGKTYPGGTKALEDVSFSIDKGEIFCLLGRNGAGKTTLLRILATQLRPTLGRASVLGHDVLADPKSIRPHIAVVPQEARPQMLLSPYDHVFYMCLIRGRTRADARERTRKVMDELGLWEHRDKLAADLSGGLRQRLIIAMAMVADPEVLFLDEPTIGLDPLGRRSVWSMLRALTKKGVTILLTTHYLDEAEILADHLLIVDKGRTVFLGTVEEAKGDTGVGMRVIIESAAGNGAGPPEVLEPRSAEEILSIVERGLRERRKVTFKPASLEDAFIKIVGGSIESENT